MDGLFAYFCLFVLYHGPWGKAKKFDMSGESGMINKGVLTVFVKTPFYDQKEREDENGEKS